ncbi:winged helix-turn-helix domain-containing protein [Streptomyces sp. V4I2]|uniref:winged helix-turn-helix domain-containing protein n=1 Tax=Streptomyces sp. V4I2 TaxID=3042280 RepID=UPI0027894611|nr:winged helix-turn-helix domain-containing protein [Streptomyces sp. V4I2]MDQ1045040.1 DNA-binding winged helix-turn-helix (wHTH) protein [Streptomyces sp. V4I2]
MTTALPAQATPNDQPLSDTRRLRLVGDTAQSGAKGHSPAPLVGYLVLVPEGTDPAELFVKDRQGPEIRPIAAADSNLVRRTGDDVVRIDTARHVAEVDGHELDLTYLEFALLAHLVLHPHHVHSRDQLVAAVWGYAHIGDGRTVDVHIARLRRKLGEAHRHRIVTVRRVGYKYVPDQQQSPNAALRGRP